MGRIGALAHCPTFTYGPPLCPVYMHTLYKHACFIRCKSLANEFALSLTENIRNSNIFMFNFHNSIKKRCIKKTSLSEEFNSLNAGGNVRYISVIPR